MWLCETCMWVEYAVSDQDGDLLACVAGAWKLWAKERTGAREGDTPRVRERQHGRPPKIVSTRTLWVRIFPIGWEAPEGKINRAGVENCQSIVHGQRSEDLTLHHDLLKPLNCIQLKFRSWRSLQSVLMGLCGCNLKEKLECSNGIHDGKNWHQIRISRSGERQKICWIVAMKIRGNIPFAQENLAACVADGTYTIKTWTWLMKWISYQGHEFEKTFHYCWYYSPFGGDLRSVVYVSFNCSRKHVGTV